MSYPQSNILDNQSGSLGAYQTSPPKADTLAHAVLLHGASIGMTHAFMQNLALALLTLGFRVSMFDFDYMQKVVKSGVKRPPARVPRLLAELTQWLQFFEDGQPLWLVGKSLGGRLASIVAQQPNAIVAGWAALGYPFHPLTKPNRLRVAHLLNNQRPGLVVQGTRDRMGLPEEVASYNLPDSINIRWLHHMDHGFQPYKQALLSQRQAITQSAHWLHEWCLQNK